MAIIAIGANLPGPDGASPRATCDWAVTQLAALPGFVVQGVSGWYQTAPVPPSGQPPYINGVALLQGAAEPESLLASLHAIETEAGRRRGLPNAARPLDLDLIGLDDMVRAAPDPVLPHPRMHLRSFVLLPLAELLPGWLHPVLGRTVAQLIAALPPEALEPAAIHRIDA